MTSRTLRIVLPILVLGAGATLAWVVGSSGEPPPAEPVKPFRPLVEVVSVSREQVRLDVRSHGTVRARTESRLVSEVEGRVAWTAPAFVAGGHFEAGDPLVRLDARDQALAVTRAEAAVARAQLRLAQEESEAEVAREEWETLGAGEQASSLVLREPQLAEARANLAASRADLEQAGLDLERTELLAPYAGRVREAQVDVGEFVRRGQVLATLYAVDRAEVRLPVPDRELAHLELPLGGRGLAAGAGPEVTLQAEFAGRTWAWSGRIVRTEGEIDPTTRMVRCVVMVEDPYGLQGDTDRPPLAVGMFVTAAIHGRELEALVVPRAALRGDDRVFVLGPEDRLESRAVDVLRSEPERVLLSGGVVPGERVVVSLLETATEGQAVVPVEQGP